MGPWLVAVLLWYGATGSIEFLRWRRRTTGLVAAAGGWTGGVRTVGEGAFNSAEGESGDQECSAGK